LTTPDLVAELGRWTTRKQPKGITSEALQKYIDSEHSPIRGLMLIVDMFDIAAYSTSVHFARHKIGVEHFVTSNRPDRTGVERSIDDRVDHRMLLNYQALRNIAKERMCGNAAPETRAVMLTIREILYTEALKDFGKPIALVLYTSLMRKCAYRGGCYEFKACGYWEDRV